MSRQAFQDGLNRYRAGDYQTALEHFDKAVAAGLNSQNLYLIYDSRAAVRLKIGHYKEALKDAKATIDSAPDRWQGYARAARVFLLLKKVDAAETMVRMALERLKDTEQERRVSLLDLEKDVQTAKEKHRQHALDNISKLPIELFTDVARILVHQDHSTLLALLHVSKNWRSVIENIPLLWTKLVLTQRRPKAKARLWIQHSEGRLKELVVREKCTFSPNWSGDLLDGLCWEGLEVCRLQYWDISVYLHKIKMSHTLKTLKTLEIEYDTSTDNIHIFQHVTDPGPFNLEHLSMTGCILTSHEFEQVINEITNLKSLSLTRAGVLNKSWSHFLAANPHLESLSLAWASHTRTDHQPTLEFERLKVLSLRSTVPIDIFTAKLPHLEVLAIRDCWREEVNGFVSHLVETNVGELTELRLHSCSLDDVVPFISLLRKSQNLETLQVSNISAGVMSIMEALSAHYQPPSSSRHPLLRDVPQSQTLLQEVLCPKLQHVDFSGCPEVQTGPLVRLIKSRLPVAPSSGLSDGKILPLPNMNTNISLRAGTSTSPSTNHTTTLTSAPINPSVEISRIQTLIIDHCPNVDGEWLPRIRSAVPTVSSVYMTKKTKFRSAG